MTIDYTLSLDKDTIKVFYTPLKDTSDILLIIDNDTTTLERVSTLSKLSYTPKLTISASPKLTSIVTQTPIKLIDSTKIRFLKDSLNIKYSLKRTSPLKITLLPNQIPTKLILEKGAITDVFNNISKPDTIKIIDRPSSLGTLNLSITTKDTGNYILQIKKEAKLIKQEFFTHSKIFKFNNLSATEYRAVIITDSNNNDIWDTGNTMLSKSPEKIQITEKFELRENWDKELIINIE